MDAPRAGTLLALAVLLPLALPAAAEGDAFHKGVYKWPREDMTYFFPHIRCDFVFAEHGGKDECHVNNTRLLWPTHLRVRTANGSLGHTAVTAWVDRPCMDADKEGVPTCIDPVTKKRIRIQLAYLRCDGPCLVPFQKEVAFEKGAEFHVFVEAPPAAYISVGIERRDERDPNLP